MKGIRFASAWLPLERCHCRANARHNDEYEVAHRFAGEVITQSEDWYEAVRSGLVCAAAPLAGR
jgi:hypothetical protein